MSVSLPRPATNGLLSRLTTCDFGRLEPLLRPERIQQGQVLFQPGDPVHDVWFPTSSVVSLCAMTADSGTIEVGVVGHEGIIGASAALTSQPAAQCAMVLIAGEALRLDAEELRRLVKTSPGFFECVLLYVHASLSQATQAVACSRFHDAEKRLARWLLETADRSRVRSFALTQEYLAVLLGMQRPWLTQTAQRLQERGLIRLQRGDIEIIDRDNLAAAACECYPINRLQFNRFLHQCCPDVLETACQKAL